MVIALWPVMTGKEPLACYIGSFVNSSIEPYLEERRFCHGLVMFAIPDLGVMFRCRAEGCPIDLEFAAFFGLLKFLKTRMGADRPENLVVYSSSPQFVFSFNGHSRNLAPGSERDKLLREFLVDFEIGVQFVEAPKNRAWLSPADYPSMPAGQTISLKPDPSEQRRAVVKPFQRGIKL